MAVTLLDCRRLTGPSLYGRAPTTIAELACEDAARVEQVWREQAALMLARVGWRDNELSSRAYKGGVALLLRAPFDVLLAATEINEWAAMSAAAQINDGATLPIEPKATEIDAMIREQDRPALRALAGEAQKRGLAFLWDDEAVSIGLGARSRTWPLDALPAHIEWDDLGAIPVAMITGTNGKTTSSRLLARIAEEAGYVVGYSTSDGVLVGKEQLTRGDYTGPAAARMVLRDERVTFAVLETARGGILRRGLAVDHADVALITNVKSDHFGGYGIDDLDAMLAVKSVIGHIADHVVLNGDDPVLERAKFDAPVTYFKKGSDVSRYPITFGGKAVHNVENVLGCIATARALKLPEEAIERACLSFKDNPGRGELHDVRGVTLMIDFAHNQEGVQQLMTLVRSLCGGDVYVIAGGAGDRRDADHIAVAREIAAAKHVYLRDLTNYTRGRPANEVPLLMQETIGAHATVVRDEVDGLRHAFTHAKPGDFVVLLIHLDHEAVRAFLAEMSA